MAGLQTLIQVGKVDWPFKSECKYNSISMLQYRKCYGSSVNNSEKKGIEEMFIMTLNNTHMNKLK